jgi:hypothetical protein
MLDFDLILEGIDKHLELPYEVTYRKYQDRTYDELILTVPEAGPNGESFHHAWRFQPTKIQKAQLPQNVKRDAAHIKRRIEKSRKPLDLRIAALIKTNTNRALLFS